MKKIFLMALTAVTMLSSCSKQQDETTNEVGTRTLQLSFSKAATRASDAPGDNSTEVQSMRIQVLAGSAIIKDLTLGAGDIAKVKLTTTGAAGGYYVLDVPVSATDVRVWATLASGETNLSFDKTVDINDWNGANVDFTKLPFYGEKQIQKTGNTPSTSPDGNILWYAPVTITPQMARFEVFNTIKDASMDTKAQDFFKGVNVAGVYMNNVQLTAAAGAITNAGNGDKDWGTSDWTEGNWDAAGLLAYTAGSGSFKNLFNDAYGNGVTFEGPNGIAPNNKVDAYQLWERTVPHIVLKVSYQARIGYVWDPTMNGNTGGWDFTGASWETRYGWITITGFAENANQITEIAHGKIYRLNLGALAAKFKAPENENEIPEGPIDPDPEPEAVDLQVAVTVTPWTVVDVTPTM